MDRDYDVIVVGAGGAGLAAAHMAAQTGARVLMVEAGDKAGGSTALSGGVFYAAGTSLQRRAGIEDTPEALYRYYLHINQYKLDPALVRRLCHDATPAFDWLVGLGVDFPEENLYCSGVSQGFSKSAQNLQVRRSLKIKDPAGLFCLIIMIPSDIGERFENL